MLESFMRSGAEPCEERFREFLESQQHLYTDAAQREDCVPLEAALVNAALQDVDLKGIEKQIREYKSIYDRRVNHIEFSIPSLSKMDDPTRKIYNHFKDDIYQRIIHTFESVGAEEAKKQIEIYIKRQYESYLKSSGDNSCMAATDMKSEKGSYSNAALHLVYDALVKAKVFDGYYES